MISRSYSENLCGARFDAGRREVAAEAAALALLPVNAVGSCLHHVKRQVIVAVYNSKVKLYNIKIQFTKYNFKKFTE